MSLVLQRSKQRTFHAPSTVEAVPHDSTFETEFFFPCRQALCFAIKHQDSVVSPISLLFLLCRPANVAWFIIPVTVNAVKRVLRRRAKPHVSKKTREVSPPFADCYTTSAVVREANVFFVGATFDHGAPKAILSRHFSFSARAMLCEEFRGRLALPTPARDNIASHQMSSGDTRKLSTLAMAVPVTGLAALTRISKHGEASKYFSGQVNETVNSWKWLKNYFGFVYNRHNVNLLRYRLMFTPLDARYVAAAISFDATIVIENKKRSK